MWRALLLATSIIVGMSSNADAATGAETLADIRIGERQYALWESPDRFVDVEGAFRAAKTWTALIRIRLLCEDNPGQRDATGRLIVGSGIRWAIARWTEDDLHQKLIPDYRQVCALLGLPHGEWNARESCFDLDNGARIYAVHLKSSQLTGRYAKVRGLTVAGIYIDQLEEVPEDVYEEAAIRISQPGFPQQVIVTPNPVPNTHWIAKKWRETNPRPDHKYISLSIWDNAHNLAPETIRAAETLYPVGHPARRTKLEGRRGLDVRGTPVYTKAFSRARHVATDTLDVNPSLPLLEAYDYGFHHPCVVWMQWAPWGWIRVLGGVMGNDLHLDEFLPVVEDYRAKWFPGEYMIQATCDPAGSAENSQGLRGTPVGMLRAWYRDHGREHVVPQFSPNANTPERRRAAIDVAATYMRHQSLDASECFLVDPERWRVVGYDASGKWDDRFESVFIDALELGYVLEGDPRHSARLGSFYVPHKDGWFEHFMNGFEYHVQQFVKDLPVPQERAPERHRAYLVEVDQAAKAKQRAALVEAQADPDEDPFDDVAERLVSGSPKRRGGSRAGY